MKRSIILLTAALAACSPVFLSGQTLQFGNLDVVQHSFGNTAAEITLSLGPGSTSGITILPTSNRGDYALTFGNTRDTDAGVMISSVRENGRDDSATGNTLAIPFYATSATVPYADGHYEVGLFHASSGGEVNMNVSVAFFPFSQYLAGIATNANGTNGGVLDTINASPGITIGTTSASVFQDNGTTGQYTLDLTGLGGHPSDGVLLVTGGKNEDNYALSRPNADGTFTIFCKDNGSNTTSYESDPVAFVYLPASGVGNNHLVALGRVNSDTTTDVAAGAFTVTKGGTGQWYLSIPGYGEHNGVLIVSPERGGTAAGATGNMSDNIVSAQWDAGNSRWVVESRDLTNATTQPSLQNGAEGAEDVFSFAFFTLNSLNESPIVSLSAPATHTLGEASSLVLSATATDPDGSVAKVEFFDGATYLGEVTAAPYEFTVTDPVVGSRSYTAHAIDNEGGIGVSGTVTVSVLPPPGPGALYFDGVDDRVTFGNNTALGLSSFTLELWFLRQGTGVGASSGSGGVTVEPLISKGRGESDGSNVDCNYLFGIESSSGRLAADFEDMNSGLNHPVRGATVVPTGVWQHAAVTFDAATYEWRLYLNGVLEAVASTNGQIPRYDSIQHAGLASAFNSTGVAAGAFFGFIDEARIWDRALTQLEIQQGINQQITSATNLVARWGMEEALGDTITGTGSGAVAGTLVNGVIRTTFSAPFDALIAPTVELTAPADGITHIDSVPLTLTATAADVDGTIVRVEFYRDGQLIGSDETAPYEFVETQPGAGTYAYNARAIDNHDQAAESTPVTVTVVFNPASPPANTALRFDGVDDHVTMGVALELGLGGPPTNGFTIECWFRKEGTGVTTGSGSGGVTGVPLFGKGRGENDGSEIDCDYFFGININGLLVADFESYQTGSNHPVTADHEPIQNGRWYHAAATYDGNAGLWKLYLDGVEVGTATATPGIIPRYDSIQHFGIATAMTSTGATAGAFAGRIDEVRLWNYARTGGQIAEDRLREISGAPGLIGRYGLNEAAGATVANTADVAGRPAGTIVGDPVWVSGAPFTTQNAAPSVALQTPAPGAETMFPYPYTLSAEASDSDGSVARVEFYVNNGKVGEDAEAPYSLEWSPPSVGSFTVTARAIDNLGGAGVSAAVSIQVTPNPNQPGTVTPGFPADGTTGVGAATTLTVEISDPEGDGGTVTFYGRKTVPPVPGPDFTIVTLPDTQYYSENTGGTRFQQFLDQTNWIVDNRNTLNIAFVSHMGDITDDGDLIPQQWVNANQAMSILEDHATTLRAYGIPFGAAPGNHDQSSIGNPASVSAYYNQYFGVSRYEGRPYWGGNYGDDNDNNYQLFSASGLDFIIIHLEYRTAADPSVIAWADALLKAHPHRRGIVTSHYIIGGGNPASFGGQGRGIYDGLKNNPNLFLLLCGHIHAEGRRSDTYEGRTIHSILQDYQGTPNGGSGFLRYFKFSPADNTITAESWSPTLNRAPAASDNIPGFGGTFTISYDMQTPVGDWIPLGTATLDANGTAASIEWTGLEPGAHYEWYAEVFDGINHSAASEVRRFSTANAAAPEVQLTAPVDGLTYTASGHLTLKAEANAADDAEISRVDFFQGVTRLGEDTTAPYTFDTSELVPGSYTFSAVAVDDKGEVKLSNIVTVTVADRVGVAPTVEVTAPSSEDIVQVPGTVSLTAAAADSDGAVTSVAFYADGELLGEDAAAPFVFDWTDAQPGYRVITAVATDNDGLATTSAPVTIKVALTPEEAAVDGDGDLLGRLLERSLGLSDSTPNRAGTPELGVTGSGLTLTFNRAVSDLTYTVQASDDLENWTDIAENPGAVGELVTVTDANTTSPNRYLRLKVSDGVSTHTTTPVGRLTHTLTSARETALTFPLLMPVGDITGHPAGVIGAVQSSAIDDADAGWQPGALSQAGAPYLVRITGGAAAGRVFSISTQPAQANTATRLTLVTGGIDLTALGIVAGTDTYEIVPADTLETLFPAGTLQSGDASTADLLRFWNGANWITYYHDGTNWRRQGSGIADTVIVRPGQGWMLARRGETRTFVTYGTVPSVAATVDVLRGTLNHVALLPLRRTFAEASLQTVLSGWSSNNANPITGDHVRIWSGTSWLTYYHDGAAWRRQGSGVADSIVVFEPGRPVFIVRPTGSGREALTQTAGY